MATAQKRGFRFPWGGDSHREEPDPADERTLAERLGGLPEDLGRGPFDLQERPPEPASESESNKTSTSQPEAEADSDHAARSAPTTSPASPPRLVMRAPHAEPMVIAASAPVAPAPAPVATAPEPMAPEPEPAAAPTNAWPDADRRSTRPAVPSPKATPSAATAEARRANPLVAGLVRAMREAARTAHDEAVATLRTDVAARTDAIREYGTAKAADLKKAADTDVLAIRDWSKAEMARVREETESKIAARKIQLVAETERELRETDGLLARLTATIEAFEAETEAFFKNLLAEEDPGRLAGLAEQLPPPPSLEGFPGDDGMTATPRSRSGRSQPTTPPSAASDAPSEPDAATASADVAIEWSAPAAEAMTAESEADTTGAAAEAAEAIEAGIDEPPVDGLDASAAAAAEAEALEGLEDKTQLIVSGLTSVGAISAFKSALLAGPGVSAVSVNAGSDGDVLITVTHAADADIRQAIREVDAFQPRVIADDGATLVVVAREPSA